MRPSTLLCLVPLVLGNLRQEPKSCVPNADFWMSYRWSLSDAESVTLCLLIRTHSSFVEKFAADFFEGMHALGIKQSFTVIEFRTNRTDDSAEVNPTWNCSGDVSAGALDASAASGRVRRYTGDPEDAHFIIVWDVSDFRAFLDEANLISKRRGSYFVMFLSPEANEISIKTTIRYFWEKFEILNASFMFCCGSNYMYKPFEKANGTYGIVEAYTSEEAFKNGKKYRNDFFNLNNYSLPVSLFVRIPTVLNVYPRAIRENTIYKNLYRAGGYGGLDATVLATLSEHLNFQPEIRTPPADREYGYESNGTFVGSLGDVVYRSVVISFNARFIAMDGFGLVEWVTPVNNDLICLIVPTAQKIPQWLKFFRCFTLDAWLGIFSVYLVSAVFLSALEWHKQIESSTIDSFFDVYAVFISIPVDLTRSANKRMFLTACMLFNIIITGAFQGSLVTSFTTTTYYPNINTLKDFDESGLIIGINSKSLANIIGTDSPLQRRLREKIVELNGSSLNRVAYERDIAAFERKTDARLRIQTEFVRKTDSFQLLHIVKECPRSNYVSYIVPKGSPYLHVFDALITRFREAGLLKKWNNDMYDASVMEKRVVPTDDGKQKVFTIYDVQTPFYLLCLGLIVSVFVFVAEVVFRR